MLNNLAGILNDGVIAPLNSYESIMTATASGTTATLSFTSIPSTYKHLQFRMIGRGTYGAAGLTAYLDLNSNGQTGYRHHLFGDGSSASAYSTSGYGTIGGIAGSTVTANVFSAGIFDILDYTNTNKTKTLRYTAAFDANGSGQIAYGSSYTNVTAAINRVDFTVDGSWADKTTIALYGIKG